MKIQTSSEWKTIKFGDVADFNVQNTDKTYPYQDIEYVDISAVETGSLRETGKYKFSEAPGRARRMVKSGDTIIANVRPNRRSFFYFKKPKENLVVSTGFTVITPREASLDNRYAYYVISNQAFTDYLVNHAKGSAYPAVDTDTFKNAKITIPNLQNQKNIAGILSAYDDLIENNNRRIKVLEEMAQKIYTKWFVYFRFPGVKRDIDSIDTLPYGWRVGKLGDLVEVIKESVNPKELPEDFPYIGIEHLPRKSWVFNGFGRSNEANSNKSRLKKGDILFGNIRPYFHKVLLAPIVGICSSDIVVLRPKNSSYSGYTFLTVFSKTFIAQATTTSKGTKMPRGDWEALINYPVLIPSDDTLNHFESVFVDLADSARELNLTNENLKQARDLLIPKLVSGEIRV